MKNNFIKVKLSIYILWILVCLYPNQLFSQTKETVKLPVLTVDASKPDGKFKPINSMNGGPRTDIGNYFDNSEYFKAMSPPYIRLHDVALAAMGAVDVHLIFPDFRANENDPSNYRFEKSDLYVQSILDCGSKIIFRLGESIEKCQPQLYVNPPADNKKWTRICCNIIRHYNMGWGNGYKYDIRYWEIWNEPNVWECWSGTLDQYFDLYREVSTAIKKLDPTLKVGGPGWASSLDTDGGKKFLGFCRDNKLPLDFVSWHCYAASPDKLMENIEKGIAVIREYGFNHAETIFDEWNYMPGGWHNNSREETRDIFLKVEGAQGAAFAASMLPYLQKSELDGACYYCAFGSLLRFGLFDIHALPRKPFYTFVAWNRLVQCGMPVTVTGNNPATGLGIFAAVDNAKSTSAVLLSNFNDESSRFILQLKNLPIKDHLVCTEYVIDETHSLELDREQVLSSGNSGLVVEMPKATVRLILFTPEPQVGNKILK